MVYRMNPLQFQSFSRQQSVIFTYQRPTTWHIRQASI